MEKFEKYKKDIISVLNVAIFFTTLNLVGEFVIDFSLSKLTLKLKLAYIIVSGISFGLLFGAKACAKRNNIFGGILPLIAGIIMCFFGGLIDIILGAAFIGVSIAYFYGFTKYKNKQ